MVLGIFGGLWILIFALSAGFCKLIYSLSDLSSGAFYSPSAHKVLVKGH